MYEMAEMNSTTHKKIDDVILKQWCEKNQIDFCILFGSTVTGRVHANSDIDIAISSQRELSAKKLQLIGELETIMATTVDLIILHQEMSPLLLHEIMTNGKPLYISNQDIYFEKMFYAIKFYDDIALLNKWRDLSLATKLAKLKNVTSNS